MLKKQKQKRKRRNKRKRSVTMKAKLWASESSHILKASQSTIIDSEAKQLHKLHKTKQKQN